MSFCENRSAMCIYAILSFVSIAIIAMDFSIIGIYDAEKNSYSDDGTVCAELSENITSFSVTETWGSAIGVAQHWEFRADQFPGKIIKKCPTLTDDAEVYVNGRLAGKSDGKILSVLSENRIRDCTRKIKYVIKTGSVFDTVINGNKISVSFVMYDNTESKNVLAYVEGSHFFFDEFVLRDPTTNAAITRITSSPLNVIKKWDVVRYNTSHPASSFLVIGSVIGKKSFTEKTNDKDKDKDGNKKNDVCNNYFWVVPWLNIILLAIVCFCFYQIYDTYCGCIKRRFQDQNHDANQVQIDIQQTDVKVDSSIEIVAPQTTPSDTES